MNESRRDKFRCYETSHVHAFCVTFHADDGILYTLASAQFLDMVLGPNPALSQDPEAPPEQAILRFADAKVVVVGSALRSLHGNLERNDLILLRSVPPEYRGVTSLRPFVASIQVTRDVSHEN